MKIVAAGCLLAVTPETHDHLIVTVEIETDAALEARAQRIADASGLSQNTVINQALVTGLLLALMGRAAVPVLAFLALVV